MKTFKIVTEEEITNFAFSAFLFSTVGWVLLEAQLIKGNARVQAHLLASFFGLLITSVTLRRCKLWWPALANARSAPKANIDHAGHRDWIFCLALAAIVGVLGYVLRTGSITLLILCAGGISVVPWKKISFCRRHFFLSWAILAVGTSTSALIASSGSRMPFPYLLLAWAMWIVAAAQMLVTYRGADGPVSQAVPQRVDDAVTPQDNLTEQKF